MTTAKVTFNFGTFLGQERRWRHTIAELGAKHNNVWALTADTGGALGKFKKEFPESSRRRRHCRAESCRCRGGSWRLKAIFPLFLV